MTSALAPEGKEPKTPVNANATSQTLVPNIIPDNNGAILAQVQDSIVTGGEQSVAKVAEDKGQSGRVQSSNLLDQYSLPHTVSVPSTLDDSTTSVDSDGFNMFKKLPAEIRNMVWELAATDYRHDPSRLVFLYNCRKFECPNILRVNQEAETAAAGYFKKLKKFKPVREAPGTFYFHNFGESGANYPSWATGHLNGALATRILVNPVRDTVTFLSPNAGSHYDPFKKLIYQCAADGIQCLALSSKWVSIFLEDGFYMAAVDNLMKNGNLKALIVVRWETLNAGEVSVQLVNGNTIADWIYREEIEIELEEAGERRGWEWKGYLSIACLEAVP